VPSRKEPPLRPPRPLRAFVGKYGKGSWRGFSIGNDQLRRLAHAKLAPVIRECWGDAPINDDVRDLLLRAIWLGPVKDCADLAGSVALDAANSVYDRIIAVRALVTCGRNDDARKVADGMIAQPQYWPNKIIHGVVGDLFPRVLTVEELIALMERAPDPSGSDSLGWVAQEIVKAVEPESDLAVTLRDGLTDLIWRGRRQTHAFYEIQSQFHHLAPALAVLCGRKLSEATNPWDAALVRSCVIASRFGGKDWDAREPVGKLRKYFNANAEARRDAFWAELAFMDEVVPTEDDWYRLYHATHDGLVSSLTELDRPWLVEALSDETRPERRAVALHALIDEWRGQGRPRSELEVIRANLRGDEGLVRILMARTARRKPSQTTKDNRRRQKRQEGVWARQEERRLQDWKEWRNGLLDNPVDAFSPKRQGRTLENLLANPSASGAGGSRVEAASHSPATRRVEVLAKHLRGRDGPTNQPRRARQTPEGQGTEYRVREVLRCPSCRLRARPHRP